jgi:hypothetical protein
MEGGEHIVKLIRYLNYEDEMTPNKKFVYGIENSKLDSIKKGHVALLPVISFREGLIPRNFHNNTLAFRISIPLDRIQNDQYREEPIRQQQQPAQPDENFV